MIKFCSSSIIVSGVSVWSTVDISLLAKVTFSSTIHRENFTT